MSRISDLSSDPLLRNFAKDASQGAIPRIANFLSPLVEVPDITGRYKIYDSKNRYHRPQTKRGVSGGVTKIGFDASDGTYTLQPHALDFPIPIQNGMSAESARYHAMYGTQLLADAAALDHEAEVVETALASAGAGTDFDFTSSSVDPIKEIDTKILDVMKAAKNGAGIKVLFGATAWLRTKSNSNVRSRLVGGRGGAAKGASNATPTMADVRAMLFGEPQCELALYVEDTAAEGVTESISFLLDTQILIFASNDSPNTMDPSFMKSFVPMGGFMVPGVYMTQDNRDEVLKMDWSLETKVTNSAAVARINANAS